MSVIKKRVAGIPRISVLILSLFCGLLTGLLVSCDYFDLSLERFIQEQDEIGRNPGEDLPDPPDPPDPEPTVYNITINAGSPANGTVTASIAGTEVTTAPEGAVLTVTITPDSGYSLTSASYTYTIGSSPSTHPLAAGTQTITMPAADITVDVVFTAAGSAVAMRGSTTYASLKAAIDDAPAGSAGSIDEIILLQDITLPEGTETTGYTIAKYIRLVSSPGGTTITRKTGFTGSLFVVSSYNVSLTLGSAASGPLIIDGNMANVTAQAPLINVSGGILNIDAGAFLQNNRNTGTSLPGGAIAINVGTISINGGTIRDNISQSFGGGINAWGGDISMSGGTITGNSVIDAWGTGSGINIDSGSFTMSGDAVVNTNNDVYLPTDKTIAIGGALSGSGPVAKITPEAYPPPDVTVLSGDSGLVTAAAPRMQVTPDGTANYEVDSSGKLKKILSPVILQGTAAIPGSWTDPVTVTAYTDAICSNQIITDPAAVTVTGTAWQMEIPQGIPEAYLKLSTASGGGRTVSTQPVTVTGITETGKNGIPLSMDIYRLTKGTMTDGDVTIEVSGIAATYAVAGEIITLTVSPNTGYSFVPGSVKVNGSDALITGAGTVSDPYTFTMPAENEEITAEFAATTKEITAFSVSGVDGTITGTAITVVVPYGTDISSLNASITHNGASISPVSGASQDFSSPVTYTVTAEDGTTADYTVIVTIQSQGTITVNFSGAPQDETIDFSILGMSAKLQWLTEILKASVSNTDNFPGATYQWYRDGQALTDNGSDIINPGCTITGAATAALQISAKEFSLAPHELTVKITTPSSVVYSKTLTFEVE